MATTADVVPTYDGVLSSLKTPLQEFLQKLGGLEGAAATARTSLRDSILATAERSMGLDWTILALILAAYEGTEPDLRFTREPYERFARFHDRVDNATSIDADVDTDGDVETLVVRLRTATLPEGFEIRLEPSKLLYAVDREMYVQLLAMVSLPGQLFYSTQIPVCLWFLARNKKNGRFRDRRGETLFIDARKMGKLVDRTHRELSDDDVAKIAGTYHAWRGDKNASAYVDMPGFCMSAKLEGIRKHDHILTPGRYVGAEEIEDDGEPFQEKMNRLAAVLRDQTAAASKLDAAILANLKELGYGK